MNSIKTSIVVFSLLFGGALLGKYFSSFLSIEHLRGVQLGVGLLTSMFGLLLSLQLSAGKTYFDNQEQDVVLMSSRVVLLDNLLAHYGPEAREARKMLRDKVADVLTRAWPKERYATSTWSPPDEIGVFDKIEELSPRDEDQRSKRTLALRMAIDLQQTRWQTAIRIRSSTALPLMIVETAWSTIVFVSFGLLAPAGLKAIISLALFACAVSSGFFLIEEMNTPFSGVLRVSSAPIREALERLARETKPSS